MNKIRYFDHAATTMVDGAVLKEMMPYFSMEYGNPSAMYSLGRRNKRVIENARRKVAKAINAEPNEIYFTSCGSESDNLAIKGIAYANKQKGNHIITSKIEHNAVLETCSTLEKEGFEITYISVDENGLVNLEELKRAIRSTTILISIMFANNEIGTIEPIYEIGKIAKERGIVFHTDSVQAIGSIKIDVKKMNIDLLSMSAHKFYGPKGVGALYVKNGVEFNKIQNGGHQEKNKRAGTENVPGIIGIAKAIEIADNNLESNNNRISFLRNYFISKVEKNITDVKLNGHRTKRLPGNCNFSFKGVDGESLLLNLDAKGICASSGSACNTRSSKPSHVLTAIGLDKTLIDSSLRFTFGKHNTKEDVDFLINTLFQEIKKLRKVQYN